MGNFAKIDDSGLVLEIVVVNNDTFNNLPFPESEPLGVQFLHEVFQDNANWKQTSYNARFRKNFAGIGYTYDSVLDAFIPPKPYPSWLLNTETCQWQAPTPYPNDRKVYSWNEETQQWVEFTGA